MQTRSLGGGGGPIDATVYEIADLYLPKRSCFDSSAQENLIDILNSMSERIIGKIHNEVNEPDRRALDAIIFDALNLTQEERCDVYKAVTHLVETRLQKASSLRRS